MSTNKGIQQHSANARTLQGGNYTVAQVDLHQGMLPRAEDLAKYEKICPGLADRMMTMAEDEQKHRQEREKEIVESQTVHQKKVDSAISRGQWLALCVVIIVSGLSGYAIYTGHAVEGKWIACSVIVSAVLAFLGGRSRSSKPTAPVE